MKIEVNHQDTAASKVVLMMKSSKFPIFKFHFSFLSVSCLLLSWYFFKRQSTLKHEWFYVPKLMFPDIYRHSISLCDMGLQTCKTDNRKASSYKRESFWKALQVKSLNFSVQGWRYQEYSKLCPLKATVLPYHPSW